MKKHTQHTSQIFKIRLKKGDTVMVRAGKDKGKTGKIVAVHPSTNKVTVEGINVVTKHIKPNRLHPQGDKVTMNAPIWVSKVGLYDEASKKAVRVAYAFDKEGKKTRVIAKTKKAVK
ncbi:MAG: 50S ribosomal protein L24 [Candidatus Saccharibacteria bacterium]|nr:50S ribosomal protein L24 [Candidatus Saccharibacteria bacterium]